MLGFTSSDIQLQAGIVDSFISQQKPCCLSELQSIQLLDDTKMSHETSPANDDVAHTSSAVKSQPSKSDSLSTKCVEKASFVKCQYQSTFSKLELQHKRKHGTTKSTGKSWLLSLLKSMEMLNL